MKKKNQEWIHEAWRRHRKCVYYDLRDKKNHVNRDQSDHIDHEDTLIYDADESDDATIQINSLLTFNITTLSLLFLFFNIIISTEGHLGFDTKSSASGSTYI